MTHANCRSGTRSRSTLFLAALAATGAWAWAAETPGPAQTKPTTKAIVKGPATKPAAPAVAAEPVKPLTPAEQKAVDAAVVKLSNDSWKERQAGQDTLVTFGEQILPRLRELAAKADDEEIRTRATAAARQIEENAQVGGSLITLHLKDATAKDVFAALAKQAKCEFPTQPSNLFAADNGGGNFGNVNVDYDRANFWTVFKEVCNKTGLSPQQYGNDRRMTLARGASVQWNGPSYTSGPFLIVANRIHRTNSVDLAAPANVQHDFSIQMSAFAEPKLRVVGSSYNVKVDEAVDEKGNSLTSNEFMYDSMNSGQQWMWNLSARLKYPENAGKQIKTLRGSVKFLIQTRSESLDIPDVMTKKGVTQTVAGRRILLKEVKKNGEQYEVAMTMYRDGLSQQEWQSLQYPGYAVRLLDKDGRALTANGWGGGGGGNEMSYTFNFSKQMWGGNGVDGKPGEPHRLVWEIPIETRDMNVNFVFKDLPLP